MGRCRMHQHQHFDDATIAAALQTESGRRWFANAFAPHSRMSPRALYAALCAFPVAGSEPPPEDHPTLAGELRR